LANPYDTLGVTKTASAEEIKKAYRKLAREHHPDGGGDESRFKEIQGAYDLLSDPEKRKAYDAYGSANGRGGPGFAGGQFQDFDLSDLGDLSEIFGGFFGGGGGFGQRQRRPQPERGPDLQAEVHVSFEDSLAGVQVPVRVEVETACSSCGGSGAEPGTAPITCPECNGRGVTSDSHGLFSLSHPCPRCRGNGTIVEKPCRTCRGSGRERVQKTFQVKIPAGAKDGTRVRLKGRGEQGRNGGPAGDLYVVARVADSPVYERRGADLVVDVPVSYADVALGASVEVPTPDGAISLKVPAGSQPGKLLKIKGRGAPKLQGGGKGDLLARLKLTVPEKVGKRERELLEELRKVSR
jgi:molecular chaperone DnaJ